jgi:HSP20 family molecular chaperone IbpA
MNKKRSFFERLSGTSGSGDSLDSFDDEDMAIPAKKEPLRTSQLAARAAPLEDSQDEGQLPVDVHQTPSDIVIRAFVAGVRPDELSISISRDMVEISGSRMEREQVSDPDYFSRELFWGSFTRTILLPEEVDVENSSASAKDGLLTLILPKVDKARQTKLRVKAG